jgi:hypothetical protein
VNRAGAARIFACLCAVEAALGVTLVGIYRAPGLRWALLSASTRILLVTGGLGLVASGGLLVWQTVAGGSSRRRAFALGLTANLSTGLVAFLFIEGAVRVAATTTPDGITVGSVAIPPTWSERTAQSRDVLAGAVRWDTWDPAYLVPDPELGWTVAPARRSADGLYASSVEGIRSAGPDMRLAGGPSRARVALIGDSNAFSLEVPFEQSWGYHLERVLGDAVSVLNFGVDGYGLDQTYLRYRRDVRPWNPRVVLISLMGHELVRTMAVYPFVSFGWPPCVVKPRFTIDRDELTLLNVPLPAPDAILGAGRIQRLPFVDYDVGYGTSDWQWPLDHEPLALRFLAAAFPRRPLPDPRVSREATVALNRRLLTALVESVERDGAGALVAVLAESRDALLEATLAGTRVRRLDVGACLSRIPADRRKMPSGHHYTGLANEALARCTAPAVARALREAAGPPPLRGRSIPGR